MDKEALSAAALAFIKRKYVMRADDRQKGMGLAYVEAEHKELANEFASFTLSQIGGLLEDRRQRDLLANAIAEAAKKAGIYNGEIPLTGPHLLMFCDDMADCILAQDAELDDSKVAAGLPD